jgi:hypothetical protein
MLSKTLRSFRKNQKAWMAGLVVLCMVTFVMCGSIGAGGNLLESFGMRFGSRKGEVVATLYGKDILARDILELRQQRKLANTYLDQVTAMSRNQIFQAAFEASNKWEEAQKRIVQEVLMYRSFSLQQPQFRQQYLQRLSALPQLQADFVRNKKTTEAGLVNDLFRALQQEFMQMLRPPGSLYFGGTTSLEDTLDFMIWRHEADKRGIQLTPQDIDELVLKETDNRRIPKADAKKLREALQRNFRNYYTGEDTFWAALADEFRVRIARTAVMGDDRAESQYASTWATPYEFWQFYKDNRTENEIAVLPIPVRHKDFLSQVGQPTEKDLQELFEKYKDFEYIAGSDLPGFRIPPRIEVEWVNARADSEKYQKKAVQAAALTQAGFQVLGGAGQTLSGAVAAEATFLGLPFLFDMALIDKYEFDKYQLRNASYVELWDAFGSKRLHDTSYRAPENAVAVIGQAFGALGTKAPVVSSALNYYGGSALREVFDRARIGATMALAYSSPTPFKPAALAYHGSAHPAFIPLSAVKDDLTKKLEEDVARKLVQTDLGELHVKLSDLRRESTADLLTAQNVYRPEIISATLGQAMGSSATKAPIALTATITFGPPAIHNVQRAQAWQALTTALAGTDPTPFLKSVLVPLEKIRKAIDQAVAEHGFQHGRSTKPEDRFTIAEDEGLKPLKEAYVHYPFGDKQEKNFANLFFQNQGAYSPQYYPTGGSLSSDNPSFLYWKTNDKAAYVPTFEEVKDKVKDWWKFENARKLAKQEADELMAKAQGQADAQRWLKDGTKHSEPMFFLDEVSGLVKSKTPFARGPMSAYDRYRIPPEKIEYPTEGLDKELLKLTEPGQVIVKSDKPKEHYYVMALVKRTKPSEFSFYREYQTGAENLLGYLEQETNYQSEFQKGLMEQLREEARLKIIEENRDKVDEKSRSDES